MPISKKIRDSITRTSWIRKMFEEGAILKSRYGPENVFDFSLGNPNLPPPKDFHPCVINAIQENQDGIHGYMPNSGFLSARQAVAEYVSKDHGIQLTAEHIIMTCGAAGAMNVILKAILNPDDEVICPSPFFVEYTYYVDNHGGILKPVPTNPDFTLNIDAISKAMSHKTKAIILNSPNNPTGQIYSQNSLEALAECLQAYQKDNGQIIYLISDEPYRKIVYDQMHVPSILSCYTESFICTSYSKDLSIPGERIGYLAVHPEATGIQDLLAAMAMTNRILGFVNAPALMQRVVAKLQHVSIDINQYKIKRDLLCDGLASFGYQLTKPLGAFYLFPRSPVKDDVAFVRELQKERILTVPGSGFGAPGHFRIAYCVDDQTIINAMEGFKRTIENM